MITYDASKLESVKSEEYIEIDNMYTMIPIDVRLHMQHVTNYSELLCEILYRSHLYADKDIGTLYKFGRQIFEYHDLGYSFLPLKAICNNEGGDVFNMERFFELEYDRDSVLAGHVQLGGEAFEFPLFNRLSGVVADYAIQVASCHHEKWDGSGYPKGLKEEQIPLAARICAVADMYDMLMTLYPYKSGENNKGIIDALSEMSGSYLSPELVEMVKNNANRFMECDERCGSVNRF